MQLLRSSLVFSPQFHRICSHSNILSSFVLPCHYFHMNSISVTWFLSDNHLHMYSRIHVVRIKRHWQHMLTICRRNDPMTVYIVIICYYNVLHIHTHVKCYLHAYARQCDAMLCEKHHFAPITTYHRFICTTILAASIQAQLNWYSCPLTKSRVYIQLSECVFLLFVFSSDKYVQKIARIHYIAWPISIEFDCHIELMTDDAVIAMQRWMLHLFPGNALKKIFVSHFGFSCEKIPFMKEPWKRKTFHDLLGIS